MIITMIPRSTIVALAFSFTFSETSTKIYTLKLFTISLGKRLLQCMIIQKAATN